MGVWSLGYSFLGFTRLRLPSAAHPQTRLGAPAVGEEQRWPAPERPDLPTLCPDCFNQLVPASVKPFLQDRQPATANARRTPGEKWD